MENYPDIMFAGTLISCVFSCVQIMFRSSGLEILYKSSIWNNTDKIMGREFFRIDFDYLQFVFLQSFGIIESTNNDRQKNRNEYDAKEKGCWLSKLINENGTNFLSCVSKENRRKCKTDLQAYLDFCITKIVYNRTAQFNCKFHSSLFYRFDPLLFYSNGKWINREKLEIIEARII